ncbi:MAG: type II 3-dehydroquinate dehydratase [Nitrospirota bacterium]|nr:type II 3-dehydroquinate dehydratase [Nitrospirota bacterium]
MKILIIHGPNLNMLGRREASIYGNATLDDVNRQILDLSRELGMAAEVFQSNSEGGIVDAIQTKEYDVLIINPAAYTHTSVAIRDAIAAVGKPAIEVHISNIYKREEFRKESFISGVATGQISGLGVEGYLLAVRAARKIIPQ